MNYFALLGAFVLYKIFYGLIKSLILYAIPALDLKKYYDGWVIITGSTDGIGKVMSQEFAKRGFNIIQISRNEQKLKQNEENLRKLNAKIQLKYIVSDFSKAQESGWSENIQKQLEGIDVSILVNNAGVIGLNLMQDLSDSIIVDQVNVNCLALTLLTRVLVNQMKLRSQKSLIVNVSSVAGEKASPYYQVYNGTKAYVTALSQALREELRNTTKINLACFQPGFVETQMIGFQKNDTLSTITCEQAVDGFFRIVGKQETFNGHWKHIISAWLMKTLSLILPKKNSLVDKIENNIVQKIFKQFTQTK